MINNQNGTEAILPPVPSISVLLPVYNGEKFIAEAIESILFQTFSDFELLIMDDGSSDNTPLLLNEFKNKDSRIKVIVKKNEGLIATLNEGVKLARGRYIARMDADDISIKERFQKQFDFLESNNNVGVVGTGIQFIDKKGTVGASYKFPESHELIMWSMCFFCSLAHPSIMFRKELVLVEKYRNDALHAEDYDLWQRLSSLTRFSNIPDILLKLRKHESNITSLENAKHLQNSLKVSSKFINQTLGRDIEEKILVGLVMNKINDQKAAMTVVDLMIEIKMKLQSEIIPANTVLDRDAAVRLVTMATRSDIGYMRLQIVWQAFKIYPFWILTLTKKVVCRWSKLCTTSLVG